MTSSKASASPEFPLEDVGRLLRAARAKVGMTRKQLAQASGASERYLAHLEAGEGNPTLSVLTALAEALDMPPAELLPLGGERDKSFARATAAVRRLPPDGLRSLMEWLHSSASVRDTKAARIVLVGLRGAGKTTLGRLLAEELEVPFVEMSKCVEEAYGGTIGLLLEMSGQSALRRYENQVWDEICRDQQRAVIAVPGGIVADPSLYDRMLMTAHSIWLEASPEDHMKRVMAQGDFRPMASNRGAMDDLKAILSARDDDYARADARVNTSASDLDETLLRLCACARSLVGEAG